MIDWLENIILFLLVIFLGACGLVVLMGAYAVMFLFWVTAFAMNLIAHIFCINTNIPSKEDK